MTEEEKRAREAAAAQLLAKLEGFLDADGDFSKFQDRVKALEASFEGFSGLDVKAVNESLERLKAGQSRLVNEIKRSKHGLYVPGIEDEDFSVLKLSLIHI